MGTKKIKTLFENWDQFDELETEKIIRKHTNNYNNHSAIKAVIRYFKNTKEGLELDIKNFSTVDKITGESSVWSLNYDKLGDVEFFINNKKYDEEYSLSALKKIMSKNQLGEVIDELEKKLNPSTNPEPENEQNKMYFKVGLLFAEKKIYSKIVSVEGVKTTKYYYQNEVFDNPTQLSKHLNLTRQYINDSFTGASSNHNIFRNKKQLKRIVEYCTENTITMDQEFLNKYSALDENRE